MHSLQNIIQTFLVSDLLLGEAAEQLTEDDNLLLSGLVDSIGMVRLIAHLESILQVHIPPEDVTLENFQSIRVMSRYLHSLTPHRS